VLKFYGFFLNPGYFEGDSCYKALFAEEEPPFYAPAGVPSL
jgi:hypothetical protein